ncbi:MAG: tetratricopeptide repeat protein [Rhodospirillales bacterium]|nr:MAG: tetratricopeptide repeat protein [Rhodospirillales bacterium]
MRRLAAVTAFVCLATSAAGAGAQSPFADPNRQYQSCMAVARSEPRRALEVAQSWHAAGGGIGARHCAAIAMYELGQYIEAAQRLEGLGREMTGQSLALRAEVFAQSGQAYQAARIADRALQMQNAAILLDPKNAEIWVDRSITYAAVGAYRDAVADLTRALSLAPARPDILVVRAAAHRNLNDAAAARNDAEAALKLEPNYPEGLLERGLARRMLRDKAGSDADLRKVLSVVPANSELAERANAGLAAPLGPPPAAVPGTPPAPRKPGEKPR